MELSFTKNKNLVQNNLSTGIQLSSGIEEKLALAIKQDKALTDLKMPIMLGKGEITASGPAEEFKFKDSPNVSIFGGASSELRIAIYNSAEEVTKDLMKNDKLKIELPSIDATKVYGLFSCGYTVNGDVEGEWPFGSVSLSANADTSIEKRAAVIVTLENNVGIQSAIVSLMSELKSPKQVQTVQDLLPGTYLVMEREGALNTNFGAQVGFDFDWAHESQNPNFPGTLGLQAKLGAQLGVGLNLTGEFTLIVSRPNEDEVIHLQLYKRKLNGWNFAAGLNATIQGDLNELEEFSIDDLIKATIGIHHGQIFEDLKEIRNLTSPDELKKKLHGLTDDVLKEITKTATFKTARKKLVNLLDKWEAAGDEAGGAILKLLEENTSVNLGALQEEFNRLGTEGVSDFLEEKLQKTGFHDTQFGQTLGAIVPFDDLFDIVAEQELVDMLQDKALKISELLDLQEIIKNLHSSISEKLSIDRIRKAAKSGNLEDLGDWLKGKLSSLTQNDLVDELRSIDLFISNLENNAVEIFEKVKKALRKEYGMSFAYSYQKEKEHSVLVDVKFNFAANKKLSGVLDEVLDGDYSQLLTNSVIEGIHLAKGSLTHGIKKQKTLSLTIPGAKRNFTRINQSIAKGTFIDEIDGRLIMYELNASDTIRRNKRLIQVALIGNYFGKKKGHSFGIEKESLKMSFNFKLQNKNLKTRHLEQIIEPFIKVNLSKPFSEATDLTTDDWIKKMDEDIEKYNANGKRRFGKSLINMSLKIPSKIGTVWLDAPANKKHKVYKDVSAAIQTRMRELVQTFAYENEEMFTKNYNRERLHAILLYMSLPILNDIDYNYSDLIKKPSSVTTRLSRNIALLVKKLRNDPDAEVRRSADDFDNIKGSIAKIVHMMRHDKLFNQQLENLVSKERNIVQRVIKSAIKISGLKEIALVDPEIAIKKLSKFGSQLTDTLNDVSVGFISIRNDYTRFMGPNLFITASRALDPSVTNNTTGFLELIVLKESSNFEMERYLDGEKPDINDMIVSQLITDLD